jgi:uncharacterized SAM-binding protein YcdF (DUF218 family)
MFFILSKLLQFALSPAIWVLTLLFLAIFAQSPKRRVLWLRSAIVLLLALTNPFLSNQAWQTWEAPLVPMRMVAHGAFDAAVLLTGIAAPDRPQTDRVFVVLGADRVFHTVQLWRQGSFAHIIISGGSGTLSGEHGRSEAAQLRQLLLQSGVPDSAIVLEEKARNTRENAVYTAQLLAQRPALAPRQRLLLVTSAFHIRRATGCFQRAGISAMPFPASYTGEPQRWTLDAVIVPQAAAFYHWDRLIHEIAGYLTYRLAGYC